MKVLATSDLHGTLPDVPECDVLILGGDICPDFMQWRYSSVEKLDKGEQQQRHWLDTTFRNWLDEVPAKHIIGIAGNHDYVFEHPFLIPDDLRWTYLRDDTARVEDLLIYGTPWVPNLPRWAFYGSPAALQARADIIPSGLDVLVSHGPPHMVGDLVPWTPKYARKYDTPPEGENVGDPTLLGAIARAKPRAVVCGHIHEAYGHYKIHGAELGLWNVALNDAQYNPVNPIIELPL